MRLSTKIIIAVAVVLLIGVPYAVYALEYRGNYNVTVSFTASSEILGELTITEVSITSEPTDVMQLWDQLKSHNLDERGYGYQIYLEITVTGQLIGTGITAMLVNAGETQDQTVTALNVRPGEASVRIYIEDILLDNIVYDQTFEEVIG